MHDNKISLRKVIGFKTAVLIVINSLVGTGIFFVPEILHSHFSNNIWSSFYVWIILGVFSILISLIYSDLIRIFPSAGGVYEYTRNVNRFLGFIVGWIEILSIFTRVAMLTTFIAAIFNSLFKVPSIVFSVVLILLFNLITFIGIRASVKVLLIFAGWTLLTVIFGIYYGFNILKYNILDPLSLPIDLTWSYFLIFSIYIIESYAGWENVSFLAEETKNPEKNLSRALIVGNLAVILFYFVLAYLITGALALFGDFYSISPAGRFLRLFVSLQTMGTIFAWIVVSPRLLYAMARNEDLPSPFAKIHPKFRTPYIAILFQTIFIIFYIVTGTAKILLEATSVLIILMHVLVLLSYLILRKRGYGALNKRLAYSISLLGIFVLSAILLNAGKHHLLVAMNILLLGSILYISTEFARNKSLTAKFHDLTARVIDFLSKLFFSKEDLEFILRHVGNLENKNILDFGCSTGFVTIQIAKLCKSCVIYASDISFKELDILRRKIERQNIENIVLLYETSEGIRSEFTNFFDVILAIFTFSYIVNPEKTVRDISRSLKPGGILVALEYNHIFGIFDAPSWIRDEDYLRKLFNQYGIRVNVIREKRLLWEKIWIIGRKLPSNSY